jgi:phage regulator Rha-like protein
MNVLEIKNLKKDHKRSNTLINKRANLLNSYFSKEVQVANNYTKKCLTSLEIKEIQIKTTWSSHVSPVRMAIIQKTKSNKLWPD